MKGEGDGAAPVPGLGIEDGARLLGAYAWTEGRLFEVTGALAADERWPEAVVLFDAQSQQHAWHASLFAERLPLLPGLEAGGLTRAPSPAVSGALDRLASAPGSAARLAVLARVLLPRLVTGYRRHLARSRPWSDGPLTRALRLVVRDEVEAQLEAEALLETALAGAGNRDRPLEAASQVEQLLAGAGPGLVPWPGAPPPPAGQA